MHPTRYFTIETVDNGREMGIRITSTSDRPYFTTRYEDWTRFKTRQETLAAYAIFILRGGMWTNPTHLFKYKETREQLI